MFDASTVLVSLRVTCKYVRPTVLKLIIPGLTRNPGVRHWIPVVTGMTKLKPVLRLYLAPHGLLNFGLDDAGNKGS